MHTFVTPYALNSSKTSDRTACSQNVKHVASYDCLILFSVGAMTRVKYALYTGGCKRKLIILNSFEYVFRSVIPSCLNGMESWTKGFCTRTYPKRVSRTYINRLSLSQWTTRIGRWACHHGSACSLIRYSKCSPDADKPVIQRMSLQVISSKAQLI